MKIIFLVDGFPPYIGGIAMRVYRIARGLSQRGHEISVYTTFHPEAPRVERIDGIKVERHCELNPLVARFVKAPAIIMPSLFKLFSKEEVLEADVVHSFGMMSFVSLVAALLKLVRRKVFVHSGSFQLLLPYYMGGWHRFLYRLTFGIAILRYADCLISATNFEKDRLIQLGMQPNKIQVIPNAIDSDSYRQLPDPFIFRKRHGIEANEKIVLFVGMPVKWKGMDHLMLAMQDVLKKIKEARLVVVGSLLPRTNKLLRDFASADVRERIMITGPLTGKSLISAYSAANVFVLPSKIEIFGNVLIEAAASGLPIVSTRTGVAPDIVTDGRNGLFVGYGKVNQISNAITKVLTDGNFKREAEGRRNLILNTYDLERAAGQHEKVYLQLRAQT